MPSAGDVVYYLSHTQELRAIIQWKAWYNPVHPRNKSKESHDLKECYRFLDLTSRSFVAVVQMLHPELLVPVCVFYLILRALDTVEDDMTISIGEKEPLLRDFHTHIDDENWTYDGSGPDEKDREVLVKFDCVAREFNKIKEEYRVIIRDITRQMGNGMADYVKNADANADGLKTIKDYELYCHYVAGTVGEGLTQLFIEAKFASPLLLQRPELQESMSQFLQQTNIIRDVREDHDDKRHFWPKVVWSKYVDEFSDLFLQHSREKALQCSSEMVLMALGRAGGCLSYMACIKDQSTFNFVAVPQSMAIATLELCFQNPAIFDRNVKITKGSACQLLIESTRDFQHVCAVFRRYATKIRAKNNPSDPHFLAINTACIKIELYVESIFPTQVPKALTPSADQTAAADSGEAVNGQTQGAEARAKVKKNVMYPALAIFATLGVVTAVVIGAT